MNLQENILRIKEVMGITEALKRSDLPANERFKIVADKVIEYMDTKGITEIPGYNVLVSLGRVPEIGVNMKSLLYVYLKEGEYDSFVKPLIKKLKPNFTYPLIGKTGQKKHIVDTNVVVYSVGEKIVYNTFKMNGINLIFEEQKIRFKFKKGDKVIEKKPDFYWPEQNLIIEVAGLRDQQAFGGDYMQRLESAEKAVQARGNKMIILDYYSYRKNPQAFYKYVCETFD